MLPAVLLFGLSSGCSTGPAYCRARADDADCDGVPDAVDRCVDTPFGVAKDRLGCSDAQAAGCTVQATFPADGATVAGSPLFAWTGTCDVYLLEFSDDSTFPAGGTRTALRTTSTDVVSDGTERFWRVVGGLTGSSRQATTTPRALSWP